MSAENPPTLSIRLEGAIYEAALGLPLDEREAFLGRMFHDDPAGLAQMQELLRLAGDSSAFFIEAREHRSFLAGDLLERISRDSGFPEAPGNALSEEPGSRIGPYRILSRIGEGGCGVIYEAEQEAPVRRRVALKIIRLGMDTESVIKRFEVERQALALMDHPNIARVFDAGATAGGRPYFVMERVGGERITAFCDREKLGVISRIGLFIQICHAIQHAHQKGIIHRDIKPSNILVALHDGIPVPKVIDFGIAKAVSGPPSGDASRTVRTARDELIGTPAYMSPEQVEMNGLDVDTRSDIYSLGALLHELLAGRAPFDGHALASAGISEMRRTLLKSDPPLPSTMLAGLPPGELAEIAGARSEEPTRLLSRLRGDLDWIVSRAMEKNRNRRYQTANALAADLHRYLANEPVLARRRSRLYLLGKFVRRNRAACISGAAIALSLVAGLGASTWLYFGEREARAEQERFSREAEAARSNEARLRAQAQARANVAQAAAILAEGSIEEADALLKQSPVETIDPSLEAAGVFRALGHWNATYGRWPEARQCYVLLNQANRLDHPISIAEGSDLLTIPTAMLEAGDYQGYEQARLEFLDRHLPVQNSLQGEHLIKGCLLTPASPAILDRLQDAAEVCAQAAEERAAAETPPVWEILSLTLYHHRRGDPEQTLAWGSRGLAYHDLTSTRAAATLCMLAMAHHRAGHYEKAAQDLRAARALLVNAPKGEAPPDAPPRSSWISWSIARLLEREAAAEIEGGP